MTAYQLLCPCNISGTGSNLFFFCFLGVDKDGGYLGWFTDRAHGWSFYFYIKVVPHSHRGVSINQSLILLLPFLTKAFIFLLLFSLSPSSLLSHVFIHCGFYILVSFLIRKWSGNMAWKLRNCVERMLIYICVQEDSRGITISTVAVWWMGGQVERQVLNEWVGKMRMCRYWLACVLIKQQRYRKFKIPQIYSMMFRRKCGGSPSVPITCNVSR